MELLALLQALHLGAGFGQHPGQGLRVHPVLAGELLQAADALVQPGQAGRVQFQAVGMAAQGIAAFLELDQGAVQQLQGLAEPGVHRHQGLDGAHRLGQQCLGADLVILEGGQRLATAFQQAAGVRQPGMLRFQRRQFAFFGRQRFQLLQVKAQQLQAGVAVAGGSAQGFEFFPLGLPGRVFGAEFGDLVQVARMGVQEFALDLPPEQ